MGAIICHKCRLPMLCIKTQNSGKLNSYWWAYNAFGRILNPGIIMHVDAGIEVDT
jgi:chitin synthase